MSTYLLAILVGEYDFVERTNENDILLRVYTPVGQSELGNFALDVRLFTRFFSIRSFFKELI